MFYFLLIFSLPKNVTLSFLWKKKRVLLSPICKKFTDDSPLWSPGPPTNKKRTFPKINDMMKSIVANTILESSDKKFTNHSARKTVVSKLKKTNVERSGKFTGHKTVQLLDDYDEANEEEQRQLSYAISGRNNFNSPANSIQRSSWRQEPLAFSAQFLQPPRAPMPLQPISLPNSSAFGLKQSSTSLNPTMMTNAARST